MISPSNYLKKTSNKDTANSLGKEFVDDLSIVAKAKNMENLMHQLKTDFEKVSDYLINHQMAINEDKTQLMVLFPPKEEVIKLILKNNIITNQKSIKILGVTLSNDMKFDSHLWSGVSNMTKTLTNKMAIIRTIKPFISPEALGLIGGSLINSTILYAAPLWGTTTKTNIDRIQACQMRAARMIQDQAWNRKKAKSHRQTALDKLKWPNINQIIQISTSNLTKKALSGNSTHDLNRMFKKSYPTHSRKGNTIRIEHRGKINKTSSIFSVAAAINFNTLPRLLKDPDMPDKKFKSEMKKYGMSQNLLQTHHQPTKPDN